MKSVFARLGALLALLFVPGLAPAQVRDVAHLFSKEAVDQADKELAEIRRTEHRQIVLQTTAEMPAQYEQKNILSAPHMDRYARDLVEKADPPVDGLFVLVYVNPQKQRDIHVFALLHPDEAHRDAFTPANRGELKNKFEKTAKAGKAVTQADLDRALLELVDQVRNDLADNLPHPLEQPVGWVGIGWMLGGGLLLLAVLLVLGAYLRRRAAPGDPGGLSSDASPALFGQVLGGTATHWVTDPAFRPDAPAVPAEPPSGQGVTP